MAAVGVGMAVVEDGCGTVSTPEDSTADWLAGEPLGTAVVVHPSVEATAVLLTGGNLFGILRVHLADCALMALPPLLPSEARHLATVLPLVRCHPGLLEEEEKLLTECFL